MPKKIWLCFSRFDTVNAWLRGYLLQLTQLWLSYWWPALGTWGAGIQPREYSGNLLRSKGVISVESRGILISSSHEKKPI